MFILPRGTEITKEQLESFIKQHQAEVQRKYLPLKKMYEGDHQIFHQKKKADYKPDNRLVVNFAKYIVDTLNGFFLGIPIKTTHEVPQVAEYINFLDQYNNQDDNNAELSKMCSIYGHAYELIYNDEEGQVGVTYLAPTEAFLIYDDSIVKRPMYGVRYFTNTDGELEGSVSDADRIWYFDDDFNLTDETINLFGDVPIIEYKENEERIGAFETVQTLIDAYDKAISEKANDVEYYADAYLKILGASLDEKTLTSLRDNRIINLAGEDSEKIIVEFLSKPAADETQENLINRLEQLIFQISMVANINDESFGNSSGIALAYKLLAMSNLAKTKERKFTAGMNRRYKVISKFPGSKIAEDEWMGIRYTFTRNIPKNIKEEAEIAKDLAGVTSEKTQLSVLSIVDNVEDEMKQKSEEQNNVPDIPFNRINEE